MAAAKRLRMGADGPSPTADERKNRVEVLRATVKKYLPEFVRGIPEIDKGGKDTSLSLSQDAFAAGYDDDEYILLGMAIRCRLARRQYRGNPRPA